MSRNPRLNKRVKRTTGTRSSKLEHYIILTDAEKTECNYINGLKENLSEELRDKIEIKVINKIRPQNIVNRAVEEKNKKNNFSNVWIIIDRDEVAKFDELLNNARKNDIKVAWSNPCIELWFSAYFGDMKYTDTSEKCIEKFEKLLEKVSKNKYKKNNQEIYGLLIKHGNEEEAIKLAKVKMREYFAENAKASGYNPGSTVYKLVEAINGKK